MALPATQNSPDSPLSSRNELLARLVAEDEQTDEQIAAQGKITRDRLKQLKRDPAFAARVREHRERFRDEMLQVGFADKRLRVRALNANAEALYKGLADGNFQAVISIDEEGNPIMGFARDVSQEFRAYLADIAKEMGDRNGSSDSRGLTVNVGVGVNVTLDAAEREARAAAVLARLGVTDG